MAQISEPESSFRSACAPEGGLHTSVQDARIPGIEKFAYEGHLLRRHDGWVLENVVIWREQTNRNDAGTVSHGYINPRP